jgi:hypothetical protein
MARFFKRCIVAAAILLTACQEGGDAGDLLGQWRMTGSDSRYLSFAGSIVEFRLVEGTFLMNEVFGNFQHVGDSLFIHCYSIYGGKNDTLNVEQGFGFKPFDNIRLKIDVLDNDHLTLSKDGRLWSFYKY